MVVKIILCSLGILFLLSGVLQAQSILEYSTLTSAATAAASKAQKGKTQGQKEAQSSSTEGEGFIGSAMSGLYGQTDQMLSSKSAALLGQVGSSPQSAEATVNSPQQEMPPQPSNIEETPYVTLRLNSGQVIKGKLVEQNKDYTKVDVEGVVTTYFSEEISSKETK